MKKKKEGHIDRIYRKELSRLAVSPPPGLWNKIEREIPPPPRPRPAFSHKVLGAAALLCLGCWFLLRPAEAPSLSAFPIPGQGFVENSETVRADAAFASGLEKKYVPPALPETMSGRKNALKPYRPSRQSEKRKGDNNIPLPEVGNTAALPELPGSVLPPAQGQWKLPERLPTLKAGLTSAHAFPPDYPPAPPATAQYPGISYEWHAEWLAPLTNGLGEQLGLEQPDWKGDRRLGLALDVRLSNHWAIRTGLGIREMNLGYERQALLEYAPGYPSATVEGLYISNYKYRTSAGLEMTTAVGFRQGQSSGPPAPGEVFEFSLEMAQQIGYYSVPLEALYYLKAEGLQVNLRAGLALNGFLWEAGKTTRADFSVTGFSHQGTGLGLAALPRHFLEMTAGGGVYYRHAGGLTARLEPGLRYSLTPMFNRPSLLAGLLIGIGYQF
ncbi:MAG: hypothetical protein J5I94_07065 [Phaeodactylibacter sp.]|nr:hypothetical protein [Phaeodactylibacter sp.]